MVVGAAERRKYDATSCRRSSATRNENVMMRSAWELTNVGTPWQGWSLSDAFCFEHVSDLLFAAAHVHAVVVHEQSRVFVKDGDLEFRCVCDFWWA